MLILFFFQAEDGIRDGRVTGVQTCALPISGVAAWVLWALAILGVATLPWFDHLLRQARRPELTQLHASTIPSVLAALVAATVGAVLAGRRPAHPVGWLL